VVLFIPLVVTFYVANTVVHHEVNVVESHENWYNSHPDEKFHFLLHWCGIYQLRTALVIRIFIVAAVRCKIKKPGHASLFSECTENNENSYFRCDFKV
jgi:hypothetical protein